MVIIDRSRDVSDELSEVRTVLGRAESALERLNYLKFQNDETYVRDPDINAMMTDLKSVIERLERWRRKGRKKLDTSIDEA